jgi:hypothetical protein
VRGVVGEALAAQRGGAVDAVVVLVVLALARVRGARVEELLRHQTAQPLRGAGHGRRLHAPPRTHVQWPLWSIGVLVNEGVGARAGAREEDCIRGSEHGVL